MMQLLFHNTFDEDLNTSSNAQIQRKWRFVNATQESQGSFHDKKDAQEMIRGHVAKYWHARRRALTIVDGGIKGSSKLRVTASTTRLLNGTARSQIPIDHDQHSRPNKADEESRDEPSCDDGEDNNLEDESQSEKLWMQRLYVKRRIPLSGFEPGLNNFDIIPVDLNHSEKFCLHACKRIHTAVRSVKHANVMQIYLNHGKGRLASGLVQRTIQLLHLISYLRPYTYW